MFSYLFSRLFGRRGGSELRDYRHIKVNASEGGVSVEVDDEFLKEALRCEHDRIEESRLEVEDIVRANATSVGWLSENMNWFFIQEAGKFLSPVGSDRKHLVILTEVNRHAQNVELLSFECTDAVYSEWVKCCCDTMWHTKNKVLEDIHGNRYPVGKLCEVTCSIKYI